jgi:phosphoglycolate phosphatase
MNLLLAERGLPLLDTKKYREVFSFPVKDYYQVLGFDFTKEDFSMPAHQYIDFYNRRFNECALQEYTVEVLQFFRTKGVRQFVLSAMEHEMLEKTLNQKGILHFFEGIAGLTDHYSVSKVDQGKMLMKNFGIDAENSWLIGDTTHDFEVADSIGLSCILIADGHQSVERLRKTGAIVIENLHQLITPEFQFITQ